jgi:hypothetical protein
MARYFFHTLNETRTTDHEGYECATPAAARTMAIQTCGEMVQHDADGFWGSRPWSVTVTNAEGLIMWEVTMDGYSAPAAMNVA